MTFNLSSISTFQENDEHKAGVINSKAFTTVNSCKPQCKSFIRYQQIFYVVISIFTRV